MADRLRKNINESKLKINFDLISHDKGQNIRKEDAISIIRAMGQNPSQNDSQQALSKAGLNAKKYLNFEEFKLYADFIWNDEDEESLESMLYSAFKQLDENQSGSIDSSELRKIMLNYGEPLSSQECNDLMMLTDINHDGKISYLEFIRLFTQTLDD